VGGGRDPSPNVSHSSIFLRVRRDKLERGDVGKTQKDTEVCYYPCNKVKEESFEGIVNTEGERETREGRAKKTSFERGGLSTQSS